MGPERGSGPKICFTELIPNDKKVKKKLVAFWGVLLGSDFFKIPEALSLSRA
jgi:hypothetical protein